ncbi:RidA family protein [Pseudomonas gingeri NCPPB 3146 = LMG 5327]|uniref:RidA family protein n=2 Tax=Pseudomonas gingeri TaxID=117681 RepID=A0A7Y7XW76_9PSED|nr:RidA family protein [Pseudomonas gingeri]NVZ66335.1 RidA family protein [Pseudomonas gingeri]NVZ76732.1 RidA family protein [Pseudomonas gingeri]NWC13126.1 RidA family protein [Pseudomonas gingeri]NWE45462.1 RidA family protein [Pseudomonas gingeri]PNQ91749.1 RidA family protein [Pseudomonas gingeri NCPPB 3146 = LMG 5327]
MALDPKPQWLPFSDLLPPFKARLEALYPDPPQRFVAPLHFQLGLRDGNLLWVSGQVPRYNEEIRHTGIVGQQLSIEQAREAARLCLANFLSIVAAACDGDLERVGQVVRITGYVRAQAEFGAQSEVINAASEVLTQVFGERGRHARSAIGVHSLPGGAAVEIEGVVRLRD